MLEPIAPAKNKTDQTIFMVFISLTSFPAFRWPSSHVTWPRGKTFLPEKILLSGIFCVDAKSQMDNGLDFCAEEALAALFQPDTVAPAEYLKIHERKPGLGPEKKLMLAVLEDAIGCFQNFVYATDNRQKKWFLEAEEWFNEEESGYSPSRISVTSYDLILSTLGKD